MAVFHLAGAQAGSRNQDNLEVCIHPRRRDTLEHILWVY